MLVLALVFGCVGMFAGEAMALGASGDGGTGGYVYIRNVKSGMYLTFPSSTVNTTSTLQVSTAANSARQQWRMHHGQKADGSYYVVLHSKLNDNYVISAGDGGYGTKLRLSSYSSSGSTRNQRFDIIHGAGVARIVSHESYYGTGTWRSLQVQDGYATTNITSGTDVNQREPYSTADAKAHQYWVFEDVVRVSDQLLRIGSTPVNAVDSGKHSDVDYGATKYGSFVTTAMNDWNTKVISSTLFRPDSLTVIEDVYVRDLPFNPDNANDLALTEVSSNGKATVTFYTQKIDALPSNVQKQHTVTHELGHVLGLHENNLVNPTPTGQVPKSRGNIMSQGGYSYGSSFSLDDRACYANASTYY
jgi:hypothetical protein